MPPRARYEGRVRWTEAVPFRRCFFFPERKPRYFFGEGFFFSDELDRSVFFGTSYKELQENC